MLVAGSTCVLLCPFERRVPEARALYCVCRSLPTGTVLPCVRVVCHGSSTPTCAREYTTIALGTAYQGLTMIETYKHAILSSNEAKIVL